MAKQRQVRMEQRVPEQLMEQMAARTDEQLEAETKYKAVAMSILGARAAERYDAPKARAYFQRALAAARPQERMQIRRMADASLALAERRAGDLKQAVEKLGQTPPTSRQLLGLRMMGLVVPPPSASIALKIRGGFIGISIVLILILVGLAIVELISLPVSGGIGIAPGVLLGVILDGVVLAVLAFFGRRRQRAARAGGGGPGG